jgi:hypothetical protein
MDSNTPQDIITGRRETKKVQRSRENERKMARKEDAGPTVT